MGWVKFRGGRPQDMGIKESILGLLSPHVMDVFDNNNIRIFMPCCLDKGMHNVITITTFPANKLAPIYGKCLARSGNIRFPNRTILAGDVFGKCKFAGVLSFGLWLTQSISLRCLSR